MKQDFIDALRRHVAEALRQQDGEYVRGAIKIVDAHNLCFTSLPHQGTDESQDIHALSDLVRIDPDTMRHEPNEGRIQSIANQYFHSR